MFIAVDVSPTDDVVIYCDIDMKEEAEALLSHFDIYLGLIFGSVVWEAFTPQYKMRMDGFQYCPVKKRVVELDNSTIDSTKTTYLDFRRMGFSEDLLKIPDDISFNPRHQITLHVCPDVNDLLGDENGDSGTITSHCSEATLGTFRTAPSEPINYLIPPTITTPPSPPAPTTTITTTSTRTTTTTSISRRRSKSNRNSSNSPNSAGRNNKDNVIPRFSGHPNGMVFRVFHKRQQSVAGAGASSTAGVVAAEVVAAEAATAGIATAAAAAEVAASDQPAVSGVPSGVPSTRPST